MPTKVWVAGEEVLASDWNTLLQEQVVATFATAAARTAAIVTPKVGMVTFLLDTARLDWWNGTAWKALPRGDLGYAQIVANTGTFLTAPGALIPGLALALGAQSAGRLIEISTQGLLVQATTPSIASLAIRVNNVQIMQGNYWLAAGGAIQAHLRGRYVATGVAANVEIWGWTTANPTNLNAGAVNPAYVQATDIGST